MLTSYVQGDTKTGAERWMPMHPVLAAMLAEWKMRGWAEQQERAPGPDDLVVPHPRPTNRGPRVAFGGMRTDHDSYKRLRIDCSALGLRLRRSHDLRRTGITLYREDGAEKDILHLCTHGAPGSDVMELYTSFGWAKLCAQVRPLKLARQKPLRRRLEGYPLCPDLCAASRRRAIAPHRSSWSMFPAAANTKNEATSTL